MTVLMIKYHVDDVAGWRTVFDSDPMNRAEHGVTGQWVRQDVDDPATLIVALEFGDRADARAFRRLLDPVWERSGATDAWILEPAA